ncbi:hypothetical protein L1887_44524 [Cichorium endivia]|nr:hypothetical protein L1887_44524 [Cichorium endivia]
MRPFAASRTGSSKRQIASLLATFCLVSAATSASLQGAQIELSQPPSERQLSSYDGHAEQRYARGLPLSPLFKRHGDDEHEDDTDEEQKSDAHTHLEPEHHGMEHDHATSTDHQEPHTHAYDDAGHGHEDVAKAAATTQHTHTHEHGHDAHSMHMDGPSPDLVPDASIAGSELRALPVWHSHGGHGHSHGSGPVREKLNETLLFRAKGPDPLSYIEWDFAYGVGSLAQLQRFTADADVLAGTEKMGVVDGRWRKLFDENDADQRKAIAQDIASRIEDAQGQEPGRHRGLLVLHVVTAIVSCFVLLPMALVLRAAHSSLAPLVSLLYLSLLGGSMFISIIYKALTPRLYPDNAHGSMGWAILWISLITLGSDVFRLLGQIWSAVGALRSHKRAQSNAWLPTGSVADATGGPQSWRDVVGTMLGRGQSHKLSSESYDALEEEAMLSEEAQSDAHELDVEKHMHHHTAAPRRSGFSSRSGSGSGSPHRVHFNEDGEAAHRTRGASAESLVEPVNWVGSGSTAVSSPDGGRRNDLASGDSQVGPERLVASPTTTACNTPRNSIFGPDSTLLPPLSLKSVSLWRKQAHDDKAGAPQDASHPEAISYPATQPRSSRLDTFRAVLRYTRVVAARSLPILAFATSYTGLAVYTGSCRSGYKNVCLAHGIKGGIFFWFGLLTFGRYLGAYADCGWAWNKRPSAAAGARGGSSQRLAAWRRNMPSAEFVECLVIFIYGASNTWMERFGAQPGDPYTIKQIQHISIAVMFWFAGLMGMLLETRFIRNMLSFPIAYHHVAAVPLREARRRHNASRLRGGARDGARAGYDDADEELEMLVETQTQPASYSASFNPFPALVIGVTGVAMAAHHQDYVYEVEIHMLWGELLAGFAVLRCLTYFLLWLRPPTASVLPSRPPTEALAAFSLCCGGLVFMLSSEEVSFAAMRSGYGDFMAILNVAVAVVALLFCWTTVLMMLKGWAVRREVKRSLYGAQDEVLDLGTNALQLNVAANEDAHPRHMRASVTGGNAAAAAPVATTASAATAAATTDPVFVLEDEEDD